ncbi:hypothetical protein ACROYT_G027299 [Oculina patagonica]
MVVQQRIIPIINSPVPKVERGTVRVKCPAQEHNSDPEQENNSDAVEDSSVLFSCPNEGCVKVYQGYLSLEKHMSFGKCKMLPEKETLLDKAKKSYHILLQEDVSSAKALETTEVEATEGTRLPEGWALKTAKKPKRFSEAQRKYLEDKFNLGQETGHKQNPEQVSKDMRFAKKANGSRLFSKDEFLTAQQIRSFFSRTAAKLRNAVATTDEDIRAVEVEQEFCDARQVVLDDVQLRHPIVYDNLNLCDMHKKGRMKALSIAMLETVCEFFGVSTDGFIATRKAEFLFSLEEIVKGCSCCSK